MRFKPIAILVALAALITPAIAQESVTGAGGTLIAPTVVGQNITVTGVALTSGGTASITCPVQTFSASTYHWNWECGGGTLTVDSATYVLSGSMILTCAGGGRGGHVTCWHVFSGTPIAPDGTSGALFLSAKGAANNGPGTVTTFTVNWGGTASASPIAPTPNPPGMPPPSLKMTTEFHLATRQLPQLLRVQNYSGPPSGCYDYTPVAGPYPCLCTKYGCSQCITWRAQCVEQGSEYDWTYPYYWTQIYG